MIILPESDGPGGWILAEKLREKINAHHFQMIGTITASFGVAEFNEDINQTELVTRADNAMYSVKKSGKNRVSLYSQEG